MKMKTNTKGQALAELAIFGSILLFVLGVFLQYGIKMNQQQHLQMQAFRQARLFHNQRQTSGGKEASTQWLTLTAKSVPKPDSPFGLAERQIMSEQAHVTSSGDLYHVPVYNADWENGSDPNSNSDLPRIQLEIHNKRYTFYTAGYISVYFGDKEALVPTGPYTGIKYKELPTSQAYHIDFSCSDELDEKDWQDEMVLNKSEVSSMMYFEYLDYQAGEIDTSPIGIKNHHNGLQSDYFRRQTRNVSLVKEETTDNLNSTVWVRTNREEFYHPAYLNRVTQHLKNQVQEGDILIDASGAIWTRTDSNLVQATADILTPMGLPNRPLTLYIRGVYDTPIPNGGTRWNTAR